MSEQTKEKQHYKHQQKRCQESNSAVPYFIPPASRIQLFEDNRPVAIAQRKQQEIINSSPQVRKSTQVQFNIDNSPKQVAQRQKLENIFGGGTAQLQKITREEQVQAKEKNTGLPGNLKSGIENLSGISLNDVKVHSNSSKPAELNALAYAQGNDIHLGPGQETHLPHEAWHVVQQRQGRVKPTMQMKGGAVNDDPALEREADEMGKKAMTANENQNKKNLFPPITQQGSESINEGAIQRKSIREEVAHLDSKKDGVYSGSVDRYEYKNKADYDDRTAKKRENAFFQANVKVRYDSKRGVFEVPVSVNFLNNDNDGETRCYSGGDRHRPLPQADFDKAASRFMSSIPESLNNWFNIHFGNPAKAESKVSTISIQVVLTQDTSNPDFDIILSANEGRSYVQYGGGGGGKMTLCESASDSDVLIHEAGHMVLGTGDEYHEPGSRKPESKKRLGEYSWMAQDAPERLRGFYERHFQFATAFMNSTFPGCEASLVSGSREPAKEITPEFSAGGLSTDDGNSALLISLGLQFGIPLTTMREISLRIGPQISLAGVSDTDKIFSILMGVRAGLKYRTNIGSLHGDPVNFTAGIYGEAGGVLDLSDEPESLPNKKLIPYIGSDASLGIEIGQFSAGLEAGRGVMLPGGSSPDVHYYKVGLRIGVSF